MTDTIAIVEVTINLSYYPKSAKKKTEIRNSKVVIFRISAVIAFQALQFSWEKPTM